MNIYEKELEDLIMEMLQNIEPNELKNRGWRSYLYPKYMRQVSLGNYGIADIVGIDFRMKKHIDFQIIELKKDVINSNTLIQANKYAKGLRRYLSSCFPEHHISHEVILVAPKINKGDWIYLLDGYDCRAYTINFHCTKGITFRIEKDYSLIDEGFDKIDPSIHSCNPQDGVIGKLNQKPQLN